jgi:glycosyltransferase involved in cell wall biosynthesis
LANSLNVAKRIQHTYGRDAQVIYPPIDTEFFTPTYDNREDFYLMVTALAPYKQVAQAIEAFTKLGRSLLIIGSGQLFAQLRRGLPENVKLLGWQSNKTVRGHYRRCRAIIFPSEEDFGMVPLEAMACGTPVIAYASGGALETVIDINQKEGSRAPTGLLYTPQTAEGLTAAVKQFEQLDGRFKPQQLVAWAQRFGPTRFCSDFKQLVGPLLSNKGLGEPW